MLAEMEAFTAFTHLAPLIFGGVGLIVFVYMLYVVFSRKSRAREIAVLRKMAEEMEPTDPQYNQARALYMTMMLGAAGTSAASETAGHSDGGDSGGGGD